MEDYWLTLSWPLPLFRHSRATYIAQHGLSQEGVSVSFWTPKPLKSTPQDTQILWRGISKNVNLKHIIEFLSIPYDSHDIVQGYHALFDKFTHVYGWNLSILWSPLKFWTAKTFTIGIYGHPVFKSWLRPCSTMCDQYVVFIWQTILGMLIVNFKMIWSEIDTGELA